MKIIVTGGAGFIGSHLVDAAVEAGHDVHVIDNLSSGRRHQINDGAILHHADIRRLEDLTPHFQGARYVFHLAALPRVQVSLEQPKGTHEVNVDGTLNVLLASRDAGVQRVIYAASSSAYGNQERYPLKEEYEPNPMSLYGLQKYMGELLCRLFSLVYQIETVSLRFFNVYGPRLDPKGPYALVVGRFLEQRKKGERLTVVPPGTQSRDFTNVRDVVRANLLAMDSPHVGKGEVINIGAGRDRTVLELAAIVGGDTAFIEPRFEPLRTLADITRARELLGWEPQVSLEEGIEELKREAGIA